MRRLLLLAPLLTLAFAGGLNMSSNDGCLPAVWKTLDAYLVSLARKPSGLPRVPAPDASAAPGRAADDGMHVARPPGAIFEAMCTTHYSPLRAT